MADTSGTHRQASQPWLRARGMSLSGGRKSLRPPAWVERIQHVWRPAPDVPPAPLSDGPAEPFRFRWRGREVNFEGKSRRYQLLAALWDPNTGRPYASRAVTDVMGDVYPNDEKADRKLKNLLQHTRRDLERANIAVRIGNTGGKMWLDSRPD